MNDCDFILRPDSEPEIVFLKGQTENEVKELIRKEKEAERARQEKAAQHIRELEEELLEEESFSTAKLSYEDESSVCDEMLDLSSARINCGFHKNVDVFATWRKLGGVKINDDDVEPEFLNPTKELMDFLVLKLSKSFHSLKFDWTNNWNPRLSINGCATHISMEKLASAYKGLLNITDDMNAQAVLVNIVTKKMKELFV
jgi:hypothetical protein